MLEEAQGVPQEYHGKMKNLVASELGFNGEPLEADYGLCLSLIIFTILRARPTFNLAYNPQPSHGQEATRVVDWGMPSLGIHR